MVSLPVQAVATACLLLLLAQLRAAPVMVADDLGRPVSLSGPAKRIVSLAPHVTEDLFAIGAGDRIVGAVDFSDYPPAAQRITRVGGYSGFDLERIRSLRPDLIVAWGSGNADRQLEQILLLGIPVYISQAERLEDIPITLLRLGQLSGQQAGAEKAAGAYRTQLQQLRQRYAQRSPVKVFYQVWQRPLMTINGRQYISDALRICGAVNVFADARSLVPTVDVEAVVAARPQAIITSGGEEGDPLGGWRKWRTIPAVQHGQLHVLPKDILVRMGPRLVEGTAALCAAVEQARQAGLPR